MTRGRYYETDWVIYTGPNGKDQEAWSPDGQVYEFGEGTFREAFFTGESWVFSDGVFSTSDTEITLTTTCPVPTVPPHPVAYSANPQLLQLSFPNNPGPNQVLVVTYTRQ